MKKSLLLFAVATISIGNMFAQSTNKPTHGPSKSITGMTSSGGSGGYGATYSYDPGTGNDSLLFNFLGNGISIFLGNPHGNVIQATDGKLYGMSSGGGNFNNGGIFCYNPVTGKDSVVFSFNGTNGNQAYGSLIQAPNGWLYGLTSTGGIGQGVMFCYNPVTGKDSVLIVFNGTNGSNPYASLLLASNGWMYGTTFTGGANGVGTIFCFNPATGQDSVVVNFNTTDGGYPQGSLIQASNGLLYGMANVGGDTNVGTIFCLNTVTGKDSVLFSFGYNIGYGPTGALLQASNGLLYGMTAWGGPNDAGMVFQYNPVNGKDSILVIFNGTNGGNATGSLIQATDGLLYGMTPYQGSNGEGIIFSYNIATGYDSVLENLNGQQNGNQPLGDLLQASDGFFYGMTSKGGNVGGGAFFRLNAATLQDTILLNFGSSQYLTQNSPMMASNGLMYGMTYSGGTSDQGTLFSYNPSTGKDTILVEFNGGSGSLPYGSLVQATDGLLYGVTSSANYYGNIFSYDPITGKDSDRFIFNGTDGETPEGTLIQATDGLLYGTAYNGGKHNAGVLYSFNPVTGAEKVLVDFHDTIGTSPNGSLIQAADGLLYGTAYGGTYTTTGMLFSYDIGTGKYDTIMSLNYGSGSPQGNVIVDTTAHMIYGASTNGGSNGVGAMFGYNMKTKTVSTLIDFNNTNGYWPTGIIMWDTAANLLYGTTYYGGTYNYGVLYMYNPATGKDSTLLNFHDSLPSNRPMHVKSSFGGAVGANPCGIMLTKSKSIITSVVNAPIISKGAISVYPNPSNGKFTIEVKGNGEKVKVEVYNMLGENVYSQLSILNSPFSIDLNNQAPGVYFIRSYDEGGKNIATAKIVVE